MDSGQEQNYWPGFVDALSNVVLTLVFVLVIFVFALVLASNKVEQKMQEIVTAENQSLAEHEAQKVDLQKIEELKKELEQAKAELAALKSEDLGKSKEEDVGKQSLSETSKILEDKEITVQKDDINPEAFEGAVDINEDKGMLIIGFPETISKMDAKSEEDVSSKIQSLKAAGQVQKILIKSVMGKETFSVAQRTAYYRAVNIRNLLITKLGVNAGDISSSIVTPDSSGIGRVEIIFKK